MNTKSCTALLNLICLTTVLLASGHAERCDPETNCKPPHCRCWSDRAVPGGLKSKNAPQIVLLTFGNSINTATKNHSSQIMKNLRNPNMCPALATFFIEHQNTNFREVKQLYDEGFEIGMSTLNDTLPQSPNDWLDNIRGVQKGLIEAGIPKKDLKGFRSAQLYAGGDDAIRAFDKLDILYDSTCVNRRFTQPNEMIWPYTYDYPEHSPSCGIGKTPRKPHKGTWQMLVADLLFKGHNCPSPSSCSQYINGTEDVYTFLYENFINHYNGNRAPFILYLDPLWLTKKEQFNGTRMFLDFIVALKDAWFVTFSQALDWIKYPVNKTLALKYTPWACEPTPTPPPAPKHTFRRHKNLRPIMHNGIVNMKISDMQRPTQQRNRRFPLH